MRISLIRDAESEALIRDIANPIFREAGLTPDSIHIYLVNSSVLNAFVAGGQNMFIDTGLITWTEDPNMIAGVMAHESGHIAGGHLVRSSQDLGGLGVGAIASYVLGAATMVAGAPDAGAAIIAGGTHVAQSLELSYSRAKEQAADQSAVNTLARLHISTEGLVKLLEELNSKQHQMFEKVNPYAQTHPLSSERVQFLRTAAGNAESTPPSKELQMRYARMVAKILAFIEDPEGVKRRYPSSDHSPPALTAQAVLAHRSGDVATAIAKIDELIKDSPNDGYLHELKGQILFEDGKLPESIKSYQKAVELLPKQPLIRLGLGSAYLAANDYTKAIEQLKRVTDEDRNDPITWRQLGIAYGKAGDLGHSYRALAEEAMLTHNVRDAKRFITLGKALLSKDNSASLLRLGDMEQEIKLWKDEKR